MSGPSADFAGRLRTAVARRGRLCVGIDPHPALLDAWGLPRTADGPTAAGPPGVMVIRPSEVA